MRGAKMGRCLDLHVHRYLLGNVGRVWETLSLSSFKNEVQMQTTYPLLDARYHVCPCISLQQTGSSLDDHSPYYIKRDVLTRIEVESSLVKNLSLRPCVSVDRAGVTGWPSNP